MNQGKGIEKINTAIPKNIVNTLASFTLAIEHRLTIAIEERPPEAVQGEHEHGREVAEEEAQGGHGTALQHLDRHVVHAGQDGQVEVRQDLKRSSNG